MLIIVLLNACLGGIGLLLCRHIPHANGLSRGEWAADSNGSL
ncbi:MAG: hypothetical protein QXX94_05520 [Candidatus Bathyarchaeia archaeon]